MENDDLQVSASELLQKFEGGVGAARNPRTAAPDAGPDTRLRHALAGRPHRAGKGTGRRVRAPDQGSRAALSETL